MPSSDNWRDCVHDDKLEASPDADMPPDGMSYRSNDGSGWEIPDLFFKEVDMEIDPKPLPRIVVSPGYGDEDVEDSDNDSPDHIITSNLRRRENSPRFEERQLDLTLRNNRRAEIDLALTTAYNRRAYNVLERLEVVKAGKMGRRYPGAQPNNGPRSVQTRRRKAGKDRGFVALPDVLVNDPRNTVASAPVRGSETREPQSQPRQALGPAVVPPSSVSSRGGLSNQIRDPSIKHLQNPDKSQPINAVERSRANNGNQTTQGPTIEQGTGYREKTPAADKFYVGNGVIPEDVLQAMTTIRMMPKNKNGLPQRQAMIKHPALKSSISTAGFLRIRGPLQPFFGDLRLLTKREWQYLMKEAAPDE